VKEPIRVGDFFKTASGTWEVIETKPGGVVELFDEARVRFNRTYCRIIWLGETQGTYTRLRRRPTKKKEDK
jgi:hypothetical protein